MPQSTYDTLVASTVKTETLTGNPHYIEVVNRGTTELFFVTGGSTVADPTVAGDNTELVLASGAVIVECLGNTVKLISTGTPTYGIRVIE